MMNLKYVCKFDSHAEVLREGEFDSLCNLTTETDVKCLSFANTEEFIQKACQCENITCLIIPRALKNHTELLKSGKGILLSDDPKYTFHIIHNSLIKARDKNYVSVEFDTILGTACEIHESAFVAPKNVLIGNNVTIQENVIIREGVEIGDNVVIMSGAIIGYDACLVGKDKNGNLMPLVSAGKVKIGTNVQIGSYSVVSKGLFPFETTKVGDYSQIGFAVDLAHNVCIGKNVIVLDQSQVCGNTVIEDNVHLSPQVIISNRLKVEEDVDVAIGSVVVNNIKKGLRVAGNYAIENSKFLLWHRNKLRVK